MVRLPLSLPTRTARASSSPESIKIDGVTGKVSDDSVVFELKEAKTYTVVAGKKKVSVDVQNIKPDTKQTQPNHNLM